MARSHPAPQLRIRPQSRATYVHSLVVPRHGFSSTNSERNKNDITAQRSTRTSHKVSNTHRPTKSLKHHCTQSHHAPPKASVVDLNAAGALAPGMELGTHANRLLLTRRSIKGTPNPENLQVSDGVGYIYIPIGVLFP